MIISVAPDRLPAPKLRLETAPTSRAVASSSSLSLSWCSWDGGASPRFVPLAKEENDKTAASLLEVKVGADQGPRDGWGRWGSAEQTLGEGGPRPTSR